MIFGGFDISLFNPFNEKSLSFNFLAYKGGFQNYLLSAQELLVGGNFLMFASSYTTQKRFPLTLISLVISSGLFLNSGFRFRIFLLFASIILFLLIKEDRLKPKLAINISFIILLLASLTLTYIGQIRTYGSGFNFDSLYENTTNNIYYLLFDQGESSVFMTTSGIINIIPEKLPFKNFYPIFKTLLHPFPKFLFNKDSGDYLFEAINGVYGFRNIGQGAAYLNYGEYYLMFGWFGIFIFNFLGISF